MSSRGLFMSTRSLITAYGSNLGEWIPNWRTWERRELTTYISRRRRTLHRCIEPALRLRFKSKFQNCSYGTCEKRLVWSLVSGRLRTMLLNRLIHATDVALKEFSRTAHWLRDCLCCVIRIHWFIMSQSLSIIMSSAIQIIQSFDWI